MTAVSSMGGLEGRKNYFPRSQVIRATGREFLETVCWSEAFLAKSSTEIFRGVRRIKETFNLVPSAVCSVFLGTGGCAGLSVGRLMV